MQEALGDGFEVSEDVLEDVDTLGGMATSILGHLPVRGELIDARNGFELEVVEADPRRIKRIRVRLPHSKV